MAEETVDQADNVARRASTRAGDAVAISRPAEASPDAVLLIDAANDAIVDCNEAAVRLLHAARKEDLIGRSLWYDAPRNQKDGTPSAEKAVEMKRLVEYCGIHRFEWTGLCVDGMGYTAEVTLTPIHFDGSSYFNAVLRDLGQAGFSDNERLRLQRARDMFSAVGRVLTRAEDETHLLAEMCRIAVDTGGYRMAWVGYKQDDAEKSIKPMAVYGAEDNYLSTVPISWDGQSMGGGFSGRAVRSGETQIITDFRNDPRVKPWHEDAKKRGFNAVIALPLHDGRETFGLMGIYSERVNAFDGDEVQALEAMAENLSYGIVSLRAAKAEARNLRAKDLFAFTNGVLTRATSEQQLLEQTCAVAQDVGGYVAAWVGFKEYDAQKSVRPVGMPGSDWSWIKYISWGDKADQSLSGLALREGRTQVVQDFLASPLSEAWREEAARLKFHSCIALPLREGEETFAALTLYTDQVNAFDDDEVGVLESMADNLSYGIVSLRAAAADARNLRAREMFSAASRSLTRAVDEAHLLSEMCRIAVDVGGYVLAWVGYKLDDARQTVKVVAVSGAQNQYLADTYISWGDNPSGQGATGRAIRSGAPQVIQDFQNDPATAPWHDTAQKFNLQSCISLPLMVDGKVFGAINIYYDEPDAFDEDEMHILETMAEDLAYGLVSLRHETARKQAEEDLGKANSLLQAALEATADGLLVTTLEGKVENYNQELQRMFNLQGDFAASDSTNVMDVIAHLAVDPDSFREMVAASMAEPEEKHQHLLELKDGRVFERLTRPQRLDGKVIGRVCSFRDVSARRRHDLELLHHATHDALTGLPNRSLLTDRIEQALVRAQRTGSLFAVIFMDMDRFKLVNDSMGHEVGDRLLIHVARQMRGVLREQDTLARQGGDEFVVLLENLTHEDDASRIATHLQEALSAPFSMGSEDFQPGASMGISLFPRDGEEASVLLKHADAAMYRAKEMGGGNHQFYLPELTRDSLRRLEITSQLRYATARNELEPYYQPLYDMTQGRVIGAEALLRWHRPRLGTITPGEFIPIAEETGLIGELNAWTLRTVCTDLNAWRKAGLRDVRIALNLSPRQFDDDNLIGELNGICKAAGITPEQIEFEITESMLIHNTERAERILGELSAQGYSISLDDFGTGYSSLSYLMRFPVDKLKIDRSFISDIPGDAGKVTLARAVIAMARELGLKVVAEGVETEAQRDFLREHRCEYVQGFLIGKPMQAEAFAEMLKEG